MEKTEFVERVAAEAAISKAQAEKAVEALLGGIQSALVQGDQLTFTEVNVLSAAQLQDQAEPACASGYFPRGGPCGLPPERVERADEPELLESSDSLPAE